MQASALQVSLFTAHVQLTPWQDMRLCQALTLSPGPGDRQVTLLVLWLQQQKDTVLGSKGQRLQDLLSNPHCQGLATGGWEHTQSKCRS